MTPKLSILLPAMKGYDSVAAALGAWEAQTCRDQLEILVLCPDHLGPAAAQAAALPRGQIIVPVGSADLHEARAIGVQKASADYVMLAEDHCLPDPDWAQAILHRMEEGWDAIGSTLRPGNRTTSWAEASFLLGYGEWMIPVTGGPAKVLSGSNSTIRTQVLRQFGGNLANEMLLGAFLVRRLRDMGNRFYLEEGARMRHFDPPGWTRELFVFTLVGLGFGAVRTRRWPLVARLVYPLAAPAIAFLHWKRGFIHYRRAGAACGLRAMAPISAVVLASLWGLGEAAGAWLGVAMVAPHLWRTEVKPVDVAAVAHSTAQELAEVASPTVRAASAGLRQI